MSTVQEAVAKWQSENPVLEPEHIFVFVHGTWAKKPLWCEEHSALCSKLTDAFPNSLIYRFGWSARNSVTARSEAAKRLSEELLELSANYRRAKLFIIAHSHGGNVACYALRDAPSLEQGTIAGIICLSTPLLHGQLRWINSAVEVIPSVLFMMLTVAPPLAFLTMVAVTILLSLFYGGPNRGLKLLGVTKNQAAASIFTLANMLAFFIAWLLATKTVRSSIQTQEAMALPSKISVPVLVIRSAADEASAGLIACQIGSWLLNKITMLVAFPVLAFGFVAQKMEDFIADIIGWWIEDSKVWSVLKLQFAIMIASLCVLTYMMVVHYVFIPKGCSWCYMAYFWPLAVIVPGLLLMTFVLGIGRAHTYIFLNVSAESAPPGNHSIYQLGPLDDLKRLTGAFHHSAVIRHLKQSRPLSNGSGKFHLLQGLLETTYRNNTV